MAGALAIGGLAISGASPAGAVPIELDSDQRLGGADRYATAALVAEEIDAAAAVDTVIVASGENFPDALAAAALTEDGDIPILLVQANSIPSASRDRMFRLADTADDVIVIGGTSAVSATVFAELEDIFEDSDVVRISGDNRYATAVAVAEEVGYGDMVLLVSGESWADAVTVGSYASDNDVPVLLANGSGLPAETSAALEEALDDGTTRVVIVGGSAAVGAGVEDDLVELGFAPADISRIAGADRYATNLAFQLEQLADPFSKHFSDAENDDLWGLSVTLVSGTAFPDALAAAPLAAANDSHLVLVDPATGGASLNTLAFAATQAAPSDACLVYVAAALLCGSAAAAPLAYVPGAAVDGEVFPAAFGLGGSRVLEDIWVVGGTTAVPASVITAAAAVAGGGDVSCSVIVGGGSPTTGPDSVVFAFSSDLQTDSEADSDTEETLLVSDDILDYVEVDGEEIAAGDATQLALDLNENGYTDAVALILSGAADNMVEDTEISFLGFDADTEDYAAGVALTLRDFGSCEGTVAEDEDAPTVSITAVEGSGYTYVKFSEPLDSNEQVALETAIDTGMAGGADNDCTVLDAANNDEYICEEAAAVVWAAGDTISIAAATYTDQAGNSADADTVDIIETADYAPEIDSASKTCVKVGRGGAQSAKWVDDYAPTVAPDNVLAAIPGTINIEVTAGDVTLTAGSGATGVTANDWNVVVKQSRGLLRPTVAVSGTTLTVTIDRYVHTAADIVRVIDSSAIGEGGLAPVWDASTDDADGLVPVGVIDEELNTDNSGDLQTVTCKWAITLDTAMFDTLTPVTATPASDGEFRITVAGDPVDIENLDTTAADDEWQYDNSVAGGVRIEGVMSLIEDGSMRVEVFVGGELQRLTV